MAPGGTYRDSVLGFDVPAAGFAPWLAGALPAEAPAPDWGAAGLVLCIAGGFLLANAILFRHPRELVEEQLQAGRRRLLSVREYTFNRVQTALGFLLLLAGFGLQLAARLNEGPDQTRFLATWVGATVIGVAICQGIGWWLSQRLIQRYVRAWLIEHQPELENDSKLARELGELFGVQAAPEDTVQSYVERLRTAVGLPLRGRTPRPGPAQATAREPEPLLLGDERD